MLSFMWGKFGKRTNKTWVREFTGAQNMHTFLGRGKYDVWYVSPLPAGRLDVHFKLHEEMEDLSPNLNIIETCFTTCWTLLCLYEALETMQERALYFDTDSGIFYQDQNYLRWIWTVISGTLKMDSPLVNALLNFVLAALTIITCAPRTVPPFVKCGDISWIGKGQLSWTATFIARTCSITSPKPNQINVPSTKIFRQPKTYTLITPLKSGIKITNWCSTNVCWTPTRLSATLAVIRGAEPTTTE